VQAGPNRHLFGRQSHRTLNKGAEQRMLSHLQSHRGLCQSHWNLRRSSSTTGQEMKPNIFQVSKGYFTHPTHPAMSEECKHRNLRIGCQPEWRVGAMEYGNSGGSVSDLHLHSHRKGTTRLAAPGAEPCHPFSCLPFSNQHHDKSRYQTRQHHF
jgi:hypothetical protein